MVWKKEPGGVKTNCEDWVQGSVSRVFGMTGKNEEKMKEGGNEGRQKPGPV